MWVNVWAHHTQPQKPLGTGGVSESGRWGAMLPLTEQKRLSMEESCEAWTHLTEYDLV